MATLRGPLCSLGASGSIGRTLSYQHRIRQDRVCAWAAPEIPTTRYKWLSEMKFRLCLMHWQSLDQSQRAQYTPPSHHRKLSKFFYHNSIYLRLFPDIISFGTMCRAYPRIGDISIPYNLWVSEHDPPFPLGYSEYSAGRDGHDAEWYYEDLHNPGTYSSFTIFTICKHATPDPYVQSSCFVVPNMVALGFTHLPPFCAYGGALYHSGSWHQYGSDPIPEYTDWFWLAFSVSGPLLTISGPWGSLDFAVPAQTYTYYKGLPYGAGEFVPGIPTFRGYSDSWIIFNRYVSPGQLAWLFDAMQYPQPV